MPAAHDHEEAILHQALEIESSQERNAYLESACAGHPASLARVKTLLEASGARGDLLDAPLKMGELCHCSSIPKFRRDLSESG